MMTRFSRASTPMLLFVFAMVLAISTLILTPPPTRNVPFQPQAQVAAEDNREQLFIPGDDGVGGRGTGGGGGGKGKEDSSKLPKEIDLTIYIVYHKKLFDQLYSDLRVPLLPAPKDEQSKRFYRPNKYFTDGTEVIFLATNPTVNKTINGSNPLYEGRVIEEWSLPGYDRRIGHKMNEYGGMNSVFGSNWTQPAPRRGHQVPPTRAVGSGTGSYNSGGTGSSGGGRSGEEEWIGFLQYDMRIDSALINRLRKKIAVGTVITAGNKRPQGVGGGGGGLLGKRGRKGSLASVAPSSQKRCCLFSGVVYPTQFLLHNALGQMLVERYNKFFGTKFVLDDLPPMAVLDMFIVPADVFNRFMPFFRQLMLEVVARPRIVRYPDRSVPLSALHSYQETQTNSTGSSAARGAERSGSSGAPRPNKYRWRRAKSLDVLESALAISLGFSPLRQVQIPIRHDRPEELEGSDDE